MKLLYAPWRSNYLTQESNSSGCSFCTQISEQQDEKNFILARFNYCTVFLNLYPYNSGHVLVVPYTHESNLNNLSTQERHELIDITSLTIKILQDTLNCDGTNMGLNIGKASGGSIPDHLHAHIVPRWLGDTNFVVTTTDTKVISFDLFITYKKLKKAFDNFINHGYSEIAE